jgi:hypothetical protein
MVASIARIQSPLNFLLDQILISKYLNYDTFSKDLFPILFYDSDLHSGYEAAIYTWIYLCLFLDQPPY